MSEQNPDTQMAEFLGQFMYDPLGFVIAAYPWDSDPSIQLVKLPEPYASRYPNCQYGPDLWACELLDEIGKRVSAQAFDGVHAVPAIRAAIASGHGIGKALDCDLIVDTPQGRKRWGDLKVGDYLYAPDGKPTRIIAIPYHGQRDCYRVTFDDGASTIASGDHLWTVRGRQERRNRTYTFRTLSTLELLRHGVKRKNGAALARQWELPTHAPIESADQVEPTINPYLLGLWLGNGGGDSGRIAINDKEPLAHLRELGIEFSAAPKQGTTCLAIYAYGSRPLLRELGQLTTSGLKHFPDEVRRWAAKDRLELFRGLIDTDGTVGKQGSLSYSTVSNALARDVLWLARSLGGKAMIQPTVKRPWYLDESGVRHEGLPCYNVTLTMPRGASYAYVRRKAERLREVIQPRYLARWIDSIEPVGMRECMCVTVDRPDGLFLANDFIVTHNSAITAWLVDWIMSTRPYCQGTVTASTAPQLATKTWARIASWTKKLINADWFVVNQGRGNMRMSCRFSPADWFVAGLTCRKEEADSFAGQHAANSSSFYIFDEASAVPREIWEVAEGGLTDGEPFFFAFGNPTQNSGRFYDCFHRDRDRWLLRQIDSRTCQVTNKQTIAEWASAYGEDSDFFRVRVKGEFPGQSATQLIATEDVDKAMARTAPAFDARRDTIAFIGADVARFGDDVSTIFVRVGNAVPLVETYRELDGWQFGAKIARVIDWAVQTLGVEEVYCNIDAGGVGASPIDYLTHNGYAQYVLAVNFGGKADDQEKFFNKRAEMWSLMRDWIRDGGCLTFDDELKEDLTAPEYQWTPKMQIQLERKDDTKSRIGRSPDKGDGLALTFARRVSLITGEARRIRRDRLAAAVNRSRYQDTSTRRW